MKIINLPLDENDVIGFRAGDQVLLNGIIYVARDSAHKKIIETIERGDKPPFELKGATVYYMGPSPVRPNVVIGSAGPTTSGRMDKYTPELLKRGLKGMIGKGFRSAEVKKAIIEYKAIYFAALGGCGALIAECIKECEVIAFSELGPEAVCRIRVENFSAIVVNDIYGGDAYEEGRKKYVK